MSDFDMSQVQVAEVRSVLKKFDGDLTDDEMETAEPAEEIHVVDTEIVKHIVGGEVVYDKEEGIGEKPDFSAPTQETE
jgi:hypothetical protein